MATPLQTNTDKLTALKNKANNLPDQNPPAQLQEKTVTPTKEGLSVVPDSGFDGMSKVTVNGDANLVPENIKEGVSIFGVGGTHSGAGQFENILKGLIERSAEEIVIPEGTNKIGDYAFYKYSGLRIITLPNSLTSIGDSVFHGCTNLALTSLPNSLTSIGRYAFNVCTNLALTSLPNSLTSIDRYAFNDCTNLALTSLPNSLTSIDRYAFNGCTNLALTSLPNSLTSIGDSVFHGCTNLALTSLPNSLTSIDRYAFADCIGLVTMSLPKTLTEISNSAFRGCHNLQKIWIPSTCTMASTSAAGSIVYDCKNVVIYTDAKSKPSNWSEYFNYVSSSKQAPVHYDVSKEQFDAMQ